MSPMTMPRDLPVQCSDSAHLQQSQHVVWNLSPGKIEAHARRNLQCLPLTPNKGRMWSIVIPDGPPAASQRAHLMFLANLSESKLKGTSGRVDKMSSGMGSRSTAAVSQGLSEQRVLHHHLEPQSPLPTPIVLLTTRRRHLLQDLRATKWPSLSSKRVRQSP